MDVATIVAVGVAFVTGMGVLVKIARAYEPEWAVAQRLLGTAETRLLAPAACFTVGYSCAPGQPWQEFAPIGLGLLAGALALMFLSWIANAVGSYAQRKRRD